VKHALAMCNDTSAIKIAASAPRMHELSILPSYTFIATAHTLQWQGIARVFADMEPELHNIDPGKNESLCSRVLLNCVAVQTRV
jgi:dTDP-4-amino-4,6-dideoxygalactose transaminase